MRSLLLCALAAIAIMAIGVNGAAWAHCKLSGGTATGAFSLYQEADGMQVTITGLISAAVGTYHVHAHQYGDLASIGSCFLAVDTAVASFTSDVATDFVVAYNTTAINLYGSTSAIGRSLGFYNAIPSCLATISATAAGTCVVGIANAASNEAHVALTANPTSAYCQLVATSTGGTISGDVWFTPVGSEVGVTVVVTGLVADTIHALHVHWYGDLSSGDGLSAGGHLNPLGRYHGIAPSSERHMGDVGNTTADSSGNVNHYGTYNLLTFTAASGNIIGRAVIFHELRDDGNPANTSTSVGAAGLRWGHCVIGVSSRSHPTISSGGTMYSSTASMTSMTGTSSMTGTGSTTGLSAASSLIASPIVSLVAVLVAFVATRL
jgi:Cu-Zn family superoxide dismutase